MEQTPNLSELSESELDSLETELVGQFSTVRAEKLSIESVEQLADLGEAIDAVRAERTGRVALAAKADELAARILISEEPAQEEVAPAAELSTEDEAVELAPEAAPEAEVTVEAEALAAEDETTELAKAKPAADAEDAKDDGADEDKEDASGKPFAVEAPAEVELAPEVEVAPEAVEVAEVAEVEAAVEAPAEAAAEEIASEELSTEVPSTQEGEVVSNSLPQDGVTASAESPAVTPSAAAIAVGLPEMPETRVPAAIVASADIPGTPAGTELSDLSAVAQAFVARRGSFRGKSQAGDGDQVIVATVHGIYDDDRRLRAGEPEVNAAKIAAVTAPSAIVASGGICAPAEPYYGLQMLAEAGRPVRDALAGFQADRGQVRFIPPPKISDLANAVRVTTEAEDAAGYVVNSGSTANKPCLRVVCGSEQVATIAAVHRCVTFGNFGARTFPEQVENWVQLSIAQHAREAEQFLLDSITTCSTVVTGAASYGAARTIPTLLEQAAAGYRSRNRMSAGTTLRVLLPDWTHALIRSDLARSKQAGLEFWAVSDAEINHWFSVRGLNVSFYMDTATSGNQVFAAQSAGALLCFPTTVQAYIYAEGSFLFLDGGTLDLGLVRDSTLNSANDYQIFAETFEAVACVGVEALKLNMTVTPNGSAAPDGSLYTCA